MITQYLRKLKDSEPIWVKPPDIANQHSLNKEDFSLSGSWDKLGQSIKGGSIYKSFQMRLTGSPWEATPLYIDKAKLGQRWLKKLPVWDSMLSNIVKEGYTQRSNANKIDEYISILIGRSGHMFIYNGVHRLVCCLLSQRDDKIPVKVLLRHSEWSKFKSSCIRYQERRGNLYCQLPHPDLESIPYYWTNERAELIAEYSLVQRGSVLDAGSHWGTTSYILSINQFEVDAVEISKPHYRKAVKLSCLPGPGFKTSNSDVLSLRKSYDTLVLLNLVHHFLKDRAKLTRFVDFLSDNKFTEIFYQAHKIGDKWSPYMLPTESLKMIMEVSEMHSVKALKQFNGRQLYHIHR